MSDFVRALIWRTYNQRRFGAPRILAIALSDEADDRGGGIFQSNIGLAKKTEQTERAVRRQLRRLEESGLLITVEKSAGGPGQFNQYRIDIAALVADENPDSGSGLTRAQGPGWTASNPGSGSGLDEPLYKAFKDNYVQGALTVRVGRDPDDLKIAEWMFGKLKALNPKHREPSWPAWCKDLRLMREKDGRTKHEICELFAYANADQFWQSNILSPGTLRKQWDRLVLKRRGGGAPGAQAAPPGDGRGCSRLVADKQCAKPAAFWDREGRGLCRQCREETERERASAKA